MVLNVAGFFKPSKSNIRRPMLNQIPTSARSDALIGVSTNLVEKQKFWRWFRARPELSSPVMIRVDDTITEVEFFALDGSRLGRNKTIEINNLWDKNQMYERLKSFQFDRLCTGSGFLWHGDLSKLPQEKKERALKSLKESFRQIAINQGISIKHRDEFVNRMFLKAIDEDIRSQRFIDYIASSTIQIEHDKFDVTSYVQHFAGLTARFSPDEIVHCPLHRVDGKVDGYTPVEGLYHELILLWAIKENMLSFFRNGGVPKKLFILPDEISNNENHQWLVDVLMDRGVLQNRHGNLVLTGNVEVQDLEKNPQDMEYKDLALYLTSNVAYALRVPVSRIPYLVGSAASGGDSGGMAEAGYWAMINSDQLTIEQHINQQILKPLGVKFKFKRHYKIDSLRQAQSVQMRMDAITKMRTELQAAGMKLNKTKLLALLSGNDFNISVSDVEDLSEEEMMNPMEKSGLLNRSFAKDGQVNKEPDKIEMDTTKRRSTQNVQPENQK